MSEGGEADHWVRGHEAASAEIARLREENERAISPERHDAAITRVGWLEGEVSRLRAKYEGEGAREVQLVFNAQGDWTALPAGLWNASNWDKQRPDSAPHEVVRMREVRE